MSASTGVAVSDHLQVTDTLNRMAWCQDRHLWDELAEVLDDHVEVSYGAPVTTATPRDALVESWRKALEHTSSQHVLTGISVAPDGDDADVHLNETAWIQAEVDGAPAIYHFGTAMWCRLRRSGSSWRITGLRVTPLWTSGNPAVIGAWASPEG